MTQYTTPVAAHDHSDEDVIDLRFLFGLLKAHKWFIIFVVIICVVLGGSYSATRPPIYESSALIKVNNDSSGNTSNLSAILGMATGASSGGLMNATPADIQTALLQSDYILGKVAEDLNLTVSIEPNYFPVFGHLYAKLFLVTDEDDVQIDFFNVPPTLEATPFTLVRENNSQNYLMHNPAGDIVLKGTLGHVAMSSDGGIMLKIDAWKTTGKNQYIVTKEPVNIVASKLLANLSVKEQGEKTGILAVSYKSPNPKQAQEILNGILKAAVAANIAEKAAEATKTLDFLQEQLPQITKDLDASEKRLNTYRAETGTVDDQVEAGLLMQEIISVEKDINDLNLKKLELLENFTDQHPFIIAIDQKQQKMEQQLETIKTRLKKLPLTTQEAANFQRDIEVHGAIYSGVMQNVQQMEILKGGTVSSVRVLQEASFPVLPMPSKLSLILLVSVVLGFSLSVAILLLQYSLSKVMDPLLLEKILGVHVLGVIPYSAAQTKLFKEMGLRKVERQHYLLSLEQPKDAAVEALRSLRTALKLLSVSDDKKIIAISGCSPNVGKSFVSSNMAVLLANMGVKTLLIDADMRRGYICKVFSGKQQPGLSEYLEEKNSLDHVIQKILPGVDFIASGAFPTHPADLLMNDRFDALIKQVADQYDFILIDTPPVLAVTDASIIFKHVDIRLLLVGLAKDQLKEIELTKSILAKAGFTFDGVVCNNLYQAGKKYGYKGNYYTYNYHYQYH